MRPQRHGLNEKMLGSFEPCLLLRGLHLGDEGVGFETATLTRNNANEPASGI